MEQKLSPPVNSLAEISEAHEAIAKAEITPKTPKAQKVAVDLTDLDKKLAVPMFLLALAFLLIAGFLLHTVPDDLPANQHFSEEIRGWLWGVLGLMWPLFAIEALAHHRAHSQNMRQHIGFILLPFMRLCTRDHIDGSHVWVAGLGWRRSTPRHEKYLGRLFSGPMIVIALLVLPLVIVELIWSDKIVSNVNWRFTIQTATGFIWMAFVYEFVVMITVVQKKLRYCKQNWIDIAIIFLPLFAFLRAARLGRLLKLQQVSRTAKIYRMRGLALRSWRAVVTLDMIDKVLRRDPSYRIDKLEAEIVEKEMEIELLRGELDRLRGKS